MIEFDYIYSYTRKQAIADGVLVEIPNQLRIRTGVKFPIVCTSTVYGLLDQNNIDDEFEKLLMSMASAVIRTKTRTSRVDFNFKNEQMYALCHPDDDGITPVITIMMIDED